MGFPQVMQMERPLWRDLKPARMSGRGSTWRRKVSRSSAVQTLEELATMFPVLGSVWVWVGGHSGTNNPYMYTNCILGTNQPYMYMYTFAFWANNKPIYVHFYISSNWSSPCMASNSLAKHGS